jgi:glycosyltransferase involved in cell wall biosynthesis
MVVSPAGTDINGDLQSGGKKEAILGVFRSARLIIAQGTGMVERLAEAVPEFGRRVVVVQKSICWLGEEHFDLRGAAGLGAEEFLFFLPAGIRPVKGNLECLANLEKVHAARPHVRVVFAGPNLDSDYCARFEALVDRTKNFARWIPLIPPAGMRAAYGASDVVLNTSFSEGLSNALLEGMAAGRPVLASDIRGNRTAVVGKNGNLPSGCLFNPGDPEDFVKKALRLVDDGAFRDAFAEEGRRRAGEWPTPAEEGEGLIRAYEKAVRSETPGGAG